MPQEIQGSIIVDDLANVQHTGTHRFNGGDKFVIVDQTDSTKSVIFNLSGLPTGTQTEFTVPDSDSSLVTLTATQTLTNKTLTSPTLNGGTWVATDSTFTIADNSTPTKIARFECSSLTAGTNVFTLPNTAADTLVTLAATQTLAGKTLTAPIINGALTGTGTVASKRVMFNSGEKVGATAGWVVGSATNVGRMATLPESQTGSTLVVRIPVLTNNDIITGFHLLGQIESAGNAVTVDAELFRIDITAADITTTSLGAMTQLSVTADTAVTQANTTKTLVSPETIASDQTYYILITATTTGSTDIDLTGVCLIMTQTLFASGE